MGAFGVGLGGLRRLDRRPRLDGVPIDRLPAILPEARRGARRRVTVIGEPVLRRVSRVVTSFDEDLATLIEDMFATMEIASGVGLAANQIGVDLRVFVYDCTDTWDVRHVGHVVNPTLELPPGGTGLWLEHDEGCLSVPGPAADVNRSPTAVVTGVDRFGKPVRIEGHGLFARCLQHECDHLDGRLYVDHVSPQVRRSVLREMDEVKADVWERWGERAAALGKATDVGQSRG